MEELVTTEAAISQVDAFVADAIKSTTDSKVRTTFTEIWQAYIRYCKAIDQVPRVTMLVFQRRFSLYIFRTRRGGKQYYFCTVNYDIFEKE